MTASVTLPDGRELAYEEYGDPVGFPVLSFHGGLSSRLDAAPAATPPSPRVFGSSPPTDPASGSPPTSPGAG